ncbi:hypothetical protein GCM10023319_49590 [Nocardia iowensis]|uniref:FAD-dependent oxidoreductase 2 FAD binding domain-containing protein n=1 Tax=Nocardia iowensis TaxID=204891 RepID=A0ABX8S2H9_NOCIO|nr:hypothetical protein KV110_21535 [Nocardia iowensis]
MAVGTEVPELVSGPLRCADVLVVGFGIAGARAVNITQDSGGYSSGTCLGAGSFFGRRAGAHTALRSRRQKGD